MTEKKNGREREWDPLASLFLFSHAGFVHMYVPSAYGCVYNIFIFFGESENGILSHPCFGPSLFLAFFV